MAEPNTLSIDEAVDKLAPLAPSPEEDKPSEDNHEAISDETIEEDLAEEQADEHSEAAPAEEQPLEGSEAAESEETEEELQAEPSDDNVMQRRITVFDEGQAREITVEEAAASYLRREDYTRKTQELAAQLEATAAERQAYAETVAQVRTALDDELTDELLASDPVAYIRKKEKRDQLAEQERQLEETRQQEARARQQVIAKKERDLALQAIPEWRDAKVYAADKEKIQKFAIETLGFTEAELAQVFDHRAIRALHLAAKAHNAGGDVKATLAQKEVVKTPTGVKAKGKRPAKRRTAAEQRVADASARLAKAGSRDAVDAGAELLLAQQNLRAQARRK